MSPSPISLDAAAAEPPHPEERPVTSTHHGVTLTDSFAWMRADNWREVMADPGKLPREIRDHLAAENAYADQVLGPLGDLRRRLEAELRGRIAENDWSVPTPDGRYAYGARYEEGANHRQIVRLSRAAAAEVGPGAPPRTPEVLINGEREAEGAAYFSLASASHSPDHERLAWLADRTGGELYTLSVRDLATGRDEVLFERVTPWHCFAADARTVFAVEIDDNHRPHRVLARRAGEARQEVYRERDPAYYVSVRQTLSGAFIVIETSENKTSESYLVDARAPTRAPLRIAERLVDEEYSVEHHEDALYILTNRDARDYRIVRAPLDAPGRDNWEDVVPHRPGILIVDMIVFADYLVRLERENALPRIVVRRLADGDEHTIAFDEEAYTLGISDGFEFQTTTLRFIYASPSTPTETWDYDMATRERTLRKRRDVPSGHDPANYVVRRLSAPAADGERVPVSLIHHISTPVDGTAPALLYGYGAYGISIPAGFNANALSLVDRGVVYAIAHVRGGMDKGFDWYDRGRRAHKENTFSDFVAVADHLVAEGYAAAGRIVAHGGSAGGLLMGAVVNQAPDRFAAIIAEVPFVDVLQTMLDASLPLTPGEWREWGDPIRDEAAFHRMLGYSPINNVASQDYPPILALAGVSDPRVIYYEPAKWVAALRRHATNAPPILLRTNLEAGHGGASGRFNRLEEVALTQAFALAVVGLAEGTDRPAVAAADG